MTFETDQSPPSLSATISEGDTRASLEALRDVLARAVEATEVRHVGACECDCGPPMPAAKDIAALAGRLEDVLLRLDKLPAARKDAADDLAARRRARRTQAADPQRPGLHGNIGT